MVDYPVFQDRSEFRLWKHIRRSRMFLESKDPQGMPQKTRSAVMGSEGSVNPAVLIALLDLMESNGVTDGESLKAVVSKSRSTDCSPSVRASEIAFRGGDTSLSAELLSMSSSSLDKSHRSLMEAELYLADGLPDDAKAKALEAYGCDPRCWRAYEILEETDPEGGWGQKSNIQDIIDGRTPGAPVGQGKYQELYSIYYDWFRGRREPATDNLIHSRHYAARDPDFLLASARFSLDEKDWHSAKMMYDGILDGAPEFVVREAAYAYLSGGEPVHALKLLEDLTQTVDAMEMEIRCHLQIGSRREAMDTAAAVMESEYATLGTCLAVVRTILDHGLTEDAESLVTRLGKVYPDESSLLSLSSMVRMERGDIPGAMVLARRAVGSDRHDPAARVQMARMLLVTDKPEKASKECNKVLRYDEADRDAMTVLKDIAFSREDDRSALEMCSRILSMYPDDVPTMKSKALALGRMGDSEGAQDMLRKALSADSGRENAIDVVGMMISHEMYREAIYACFDLEKEYPRDPMVKRLKGNAEYCSGEYLKASVSFASAAEITPCDPVVWHSKGMADEARGDLRSAEDAYNRATVLDMDEARYWISKSVVQEKLGNIGGAVESLNRAIQKDTRSVYALVRKAKLFANRSRFDEAVYYMRMADAVQPGDRDILYEMMRIQMASGRLEDAVNTGEAILAMGPDAEVSSSIAECYSKLDRPDKAMAAIDASAEAVEPDAEPEPEEEPEVRREDPESLAAIASSLLAAGDTDGASRMISEALDHEPGNPRYLRVKSMVLLASGDQEGARSLVTDSLAVDPDDPGLLEAYGDILTSSGDSEAASVQYRKAAIRNQDSMGLLLKLGRSCEDNGDTTGAAGCYMRILDSGQADPDTARRLARIMISQGDLVKAEECISVITRADPNDASAWVLKAEVCRDRNDATGVLEAYSGFMSCTNVGADNKVRMVKVLEETGHPAEASDLMGESVPTEHSDKAVKRYAEKVMRRAVATQTPLDDPDLISSIVSEPLLSERVVSYLSDIPRFGDVVTGTDDFRHMERMSHDAVVKLGWKDLEGSPELPLQDVFVGCGCHDGDEAKAIVSYIRDVMGSDVGRRTDSRLAEMSMRLPRGMSVYDVMVECDIGVYEAKQVLAQIV